MGVVVKTIGHFGPIAPFQLFAWLLRPFEFECALLGAGDQVHSTGSRAVRRICPWQIFSEIRWSSVNFLYNSLQTRRYWSVRSSFVLRVPVIREERIKKPRFAENEFTRKQQWRRQTNANEVTISPPFPSALPSLYYISFVQMRKADEAAGIFRETGPLLPPCVIERPRREETIRSTRRNLFVFPRNRGEFTVQTFEMLR